MILNEYDISALIITLKLALSTTFILLVLGTPLSWWLSKTKFRLKFLIDAVIALPLVLPPTVLGFYLLIAFGPDGFIGILLDTLGIKPIAFTFTGLIAGSVIYSLPFVVQPLQDAFKSVGKQQIEVAATLGASPIDRFFTVIIPLARHGFFTAAVLGFAHTIGEFGVVLMIGGNIPGETQVLSIAIYDHVESLEYINAHWLSGILLCISFIMLISIYAVNRKFRIVQS
ncbi:MAG: molybdate ABC transporter permease subunit [Melioribacteraceae bacterium]|nr:molybdate ABC transporter permease subunit [Melioribacteraceae bacterium]